MNAYDLRLPACCRRALAAAIVVMSLAPAGARADTVASLLGNFTTNQFAQIEVRPQELRVRYALVLGQLPALRELGAADTDRNGVTSEAEREAYAQRLAPVVAGALDITVDGSPLLLRAIESRTTLPDEQGGFSLRVDATYAAPLPAGAGRHDVVFVNRNFEGRFGWQEIAIAPAQGIAVFATDGHADSLTAGLTEAVQALPADGPLAERAVRLSYRQGALPAGEIALATRSGAAAAPPAAARAADVETSIVQRATRRIVDLVSGPGLAPHVAVLALLAALLLGALHAFSPGHGKMVVGAYLIGSRATARHAGFLALTVTITHTLGVFALGFATLAASAYVVPETLLPILGVISGAVIVVMGATLAWQRWPAIRDLWRERSRSHAGALAFRVLASVSPMPGSSHVMAAMHGGSMHATGGIGRAMAAPPAGGGAGWHSHGGTWHTHLPPGAAGERISWRSLLALGISGGLVPCPSAMVLMLAAIALGKTAMGLGLVVAFSAGLALSLAGVGLAFLHARNRLAGATQAGAPASRRHAFVKRLTRVLPFASAVAILLLGIALCYSALP